MSRRLVAILPAASVCLAEGAWIAVLAALLATAGVPNVAAGPWVFALVVACGVALARLVRTRGWDRPRLVRALPIVVGIAVLLVAMTGSNVTSGIAPGALVALAVWRGSHHGDPAEDDVHMAQVLRLGLPALALPWLLGAASSGPRHDAFVADALPATLLFVAASLAAVGLTRLDALGRESGLDWASNRAWLLLLGGVVAGLGILSVPAALLIGAPVGGALRALAAPVVTAVEAGGTAIRTVIGTVGIGAGGPPAPTPGPGLPGDPAGPLGLGVPALVVSALLLLAMAGATVFVARKVRGTPRDAPEARRPREERHIKLPAPHLGLPALWRVRRRSRRGQSDPVIEAYVRVLEHLETNPELRRASQESPRVHARRVGPRAGWRLGLLAADFELARYGGRDVSPAERGRAADRGRWLRRR